MKMYKIIRILIQNLIFWVKNQNFLKFWFLISSLIYPWEIRISLIFWLCMLFAFTSASTSRSNSRPMRWCRFNAWSMFGVSCGSSDESVCAEPSPAMTHTCTGHGERCEGADWWRRPQSHGSCAVQKLNAIISCKSLYCQTTRSLFLM